MGDVRGRGGAARLIAAGIHAGGVGVAIGALEVVRLRALGSGAGELVLGAIGLATLALLALGVPLALALGAVWRAPPVERWRARVATAGATRVAALAEVALGAAAAAIGWLAIVVLVAGIHGRFRSGAATGVLVASGALVVALVLGAALVVGGGRLATWLGRRRALVALTSGRRAAVAALVTAAAIAYLATRALGHLVPAHDFAPAYLAVLALALLAAATALDLAARLPRRGRAVALVAALAIAATGPAAIGSLDGARRAIHARGVASRAALDALLWAADRDGDGHAGWFGGGDCDDGDPAVHPAARERAGNGIDDNCLEGDASPALAARRPAAPGRDAPRHDVVLVTVDALRADATSAYGHARPTTPALAALAARGVRFARAYTASPATRRAMPALFTGRYPSTLALDRERGALAPGSAPTLAASFAAAGYQTRAILCCGGYLLDERGFLAGFDRVEVLAEQGDGFKANGSAAVVARALDWLARDRDPARPALLWLHVADPHYPYEPPPGAPRFGPTARDAYDSEVAHVDRQLGRLLAALDAAGRRDATIVALTADHGEAFGEHGTRFHGDTLYDELVRVPLVVAAPGVAPRVVDAPVSTIDLLPTLLDLVGLPRPAGLGGESLAAAMAGAEPPARTILVELEPDRSIHRQLRAAVRGPWKLIWDLDAGTRELYDLAADPGERRDRASADPAAADAMWRALRQASERELALPPP